MAGVLLMAIRLGFHNHGPQQLANGLTFHQQAAYEVGGNLLGGACEEGLEEVLGELGGFRNGSIKKVPREAFNPDGRR